ncbi:MAG: hypothetical protein U0X39_05880 [Bacteroidales bacterium]
MKRTALTILLILAICQLLSSQKLPEGSRYLGQTPPGTTPVKFPLEVNKGSFAAERIAISKDGKEIYYTEVRSYYPAKGDTIKCYRFTGKGWSGPFNIFPAFLSPALSLAGDKMYMQTAGDEYDTYMSVRKGRQWTSPQRILKNLNSAHYLQYSAKGNAFISSKPAKGLGGNDWCRLLTDSTVVSLGKPLNNRQDNLDFFVARDESFIIIAVNTGLSISFPAKEGSWTTPVNLGKKINFGLASWGPYVTDDKKYLFYSTGTKPDYSDCGIFWVRVDNLIDSLKNVNNGR